MTQELSLRDLVVLPAEPRMKDVVVAERLGFSVPVDIRKLIRRNIEELRGYGEVSCHGGEKPPKGSKGGRPEEGYLLNEEQVLLVCMFSRTPQAAEVRREVIQVFTAYRQGRLGETAPAAAPIDNPLWRGMDERIGITNRVLDLEARSASDEFVRAAAFLPRSGRNYRQPNFFSDKPVLKMAIDLHRQMQVQEAVDLIRSRLGRSPSKSALHRFWRRLDGARGSKFIAA